MFLKSDAARIWDLFQGMQRETEQMLQLYRAKMCFFKYLENVNAQLSVLI